MAAPPPTEHWIALRRHSPFPTCGGLMMMMFVIMPALRDRIECWAMGIYRDTRVQKPVRVRMCAAQNQINSPHSHTLGALAHKTNGILNKRAGQFVGGQMRAQALCLSISGFNGAAVSVSLHCVRSGTSTILYTRYSIVYEQHKYDVNTQNNNTCIW